MVMTSRLHPRGEGAAGEHEQGQEEDQPAVAFDLGTEHEQV